MYGWYKLYVHVIDDKDGFNHPPNCITDLREELLNYYIIKSN